MYTYNPPSSYQEMLNFSTVVVMVILRSDENKSKYQGCCVYIYTS